MKLALVRNVAFAAFTLAGAAAYAQPRPSYGVGVRAGVDFHASLAPFGRWAANPSYGQVFYPARRDYVPYSYGHYDNTTAAGQVWVSDEPHGWATEHYGQWVETSEGWAWVPGNEYRPVVVNPYVAADARRGEWEARRAREEAARARAYEEWRIRQARESRWHDRRWDERHWRAPDVRVRDHRDGGRRGY